MAVSCDSFVQNDFLRFFCSFCLYGYRHIYLYSVGTNSSHLKLAIYETGSSVVHIAFFINEILIDQRYSGV